MADDVIINATAHSPLHRALRAATHTAHHQLDHHPLLAPLVKPTLTLHHYRHALQALLAVHQPLQAALRADFAAFAIDYPLIDRVALLCADLAVLKVSPTGTASAPLALGNADESGEREEAGGARRLATAADQVDRRGSEHRATPRCARAAIYSAFPLPAAGSEATLIGRLYVVEGSRLGGRFIARALQQRLGLTAANGAAFFNEGGEVRIDRDWPAFWRLAEGQAASAEAIIAGALATFAFITDALDAYAHTVVVR